MQGRKENEEKMGKKIKKELEICPDYMTKYYYSLNGKSYTTQKMYVYYVLDFISFLEKEFLVNVKKVDSFKEVNAGMIDYYMSTLNSTGESVRRCRLYGIKSFFTFLFKNKLIDENPCNDVEVPKDRKERKVTALNKKEINVVKESIVNGAGSELAQERQKEWVNRDYAIIMLAISLGLRVTSITEINVEDIDFEAREITVTEKNNKTRTIEFGEKLKDVLDHWIIDRQRMLKIKGKECNALFISNRMRRISVEAIRVLVNKYTGGVDKHISPHKLRATCATMLYGATKDLELTRRMLGHNNPRTTERYIGIDEEEKTRAITAMEDNLF